MVQGTEELPVNHSWSGRVPLSYVIRECSAPDYAIESQSDYDFEQLSINGVPLTGLTYNRA